MPTLSQQSQYASTKKVCVVKLFAAQAMPWLIKFLRHK
jgi:hypothetical protein